MKYAWIDGKIKFYTHEKDGKYYFDAVEGATPIEQPSTELLAKCEGKTFKNFTEAKAFIEGTSGPTSEELIQSMALAIAELDAEVQATKGGGE